jgi:riboflavin biosynthesis pyrimidine reductase
MENYEVLKSLINSIDGDIKKFTEKGNKAAGSRIRKSMQEVKALAQAIRVEIQESKKSESAE